MNSLSTLESIFAAALDKRSEEDRSAYLDEACRDDPELRRHIDRLLCAQARAGNFLQNPGPGLSVTSDPQPREQPGTIIGPYKLLQQIGEGGMGVVYMAEQEEPVRRKVALKIIKPGMDSRQVVARFEAERQALALMDHPNIARVLDAGTTDSGRPYFVMELVQGVPITGYCDDNKLTPRERLALFVPGLPGDPARPPEGHHPPRHQAVQRAGDHVRRQAGAQGDRLRRGQGDRAAAHRKDAVHPVRRARRHARVHEPRAGGAQRLGHRHAQRHLLPGRAALRAADRHDAARAGPAARGGARRDAAADPGGGSRPGRARGSAAPTTCRTIAAARKTEPARLSKLVRGELDWIVMKCLEKDRSPALRDGQRPGPRSGALPGGRARGGVSAELQLPAAQICPQVQEGADDGGGVRGPPGRRVAMSTLLAVRATSAERRGEPATNCRG